jgi:hypothetical protein
MHHGSTLLYLYVKFITLVTRIIDDLPPNKHSRVITAVAHLMSLIVDRERLPPLA